jgi:hypothetical protein
MVFNAARVSGCAGNEMMLITIASRCLTGYKYSFRLALIAISHSFTFSLRVLLSPSSLNQHGRQEGN